MGASEAHIFFLPPFFPLEMRLFLPTAMAAKGLGALRRSWCCDGGAAKEGERGGEARSHSCSRRLSLLTLISWLCSHLALFTPAPVSVLIWVLVKYLVY